MNGVLRIEQKFELLLFVNLGAVVAAAELFSPTVGKKEGRNFLALKITDDRLSGARVRTLDLFLWLRFRAFADDNGFGILLFADAAGVGIVGNADVVFSVGAVGFVDDRNSQPLVGQEDVLVRVGAEVANHFAVGVVARKTGDAFQVPAVVPILADDALDHFIRGRVFRVRIGPAADAVNSAVVLVVAVVVVERSFVGVQLARVVGELAVAAVTENKFERIIRN